MELTIFGATGQTGKHLVRQALERDHTVRAFTRSPDKIEEQHARLDVVVGDVLDAAAVERAIAGADAVLSTLGPTENTPGERIAQGSRHIVTAMERHDVQRLIVTAGAGVGSEEDQPGIIDRIVKGLLLVFARHVYEDMRRTVEVVRGTDLDWTVVRLPMLTDGASQEQIRVGYVGRDTGFRIVRTDIARFMLDELEHGEHIHDLPVISN